MGILNPGSRYELNYQGKGCGGSCLPFDTIATAVAYAAERGATQYQIWDTAAGRVIESGYRRDARYRWTVRND